MRRIARLWRREHLLPRRAAKMCGGILELGVLDKFKIAYYNRTDELIYQNLE